MDICSCGDHEEKRQDQALFYIDPKITCQPQNFEKRETFLRVDFYLSCSGWLKMSILATFSVWQCSGVSMTGYEDDDW